MRGRISTWTPWRTLLIVIDSKIIFKSYLLVGHLILQYGTIAMHGLLIASDSVCGQWPCGTARYSFHGYGHLDESSEQIFETRHISYRKIVLFKIENRESLWLLLAVN